MPFSLPKKISLIAALTRQHVIGKDGRIPWHLPADLARFKQVTMGKPIIMGRKTYESIGHPLKGRTNIVLSRTKTLNIEGTTAVHSLESALALAHTLEETMIIGGGEVFDDALGFANTMYLTWVDAEVEGDTYFPSFDRDEWLTVETREHAKVGDDSPAYTFCTLVRK